MKKGLTIILISLIATGCYIGEELPPDQEVWNYAHPSLLDMDPKTLLTIDSAIQDGSFGGIHGIIIIKNDQLIFENYYDNGNRHQKKNIGRISFAILTLAIDFFLEDGLITSIDDPIYSYLPEYDFLFEEDTIKQLITFRHILTNEMGISWAENDISDMKETSDWAAYVLSRERDTPLPGQRPAINPGGGVILAKIMQNLLESEDLQTYLNDKLLHRVGIKNYNWEKDPKGTLNAADGMDMTNIDLTRIGYLMLLEGRWLEKRRVINRNWVLEVSSVHNTIDQFFNYGMGWKIFTEQLNADFQIPGTSTYFTDGGAGQGIYIIPELDMVVSIISENYFESADINSINLFYFLLLSLEPAAVN